MSWIDQIEISEADGRLTEIYEALVEKRGKVSNILKAHSLNPEAMAAHLDLYMNLMFGESGLSRARGTYLDEEKSPDSVIAHSEAEYACS